MGNDICVSFRCISSNLYNGICLMIYKILTSNIAEFVFPVIGWSLIVHSVKYFENINTSYLQESLIPVIAIGLFHVFIIRKYIYPKIDNLFWILYKKINDHCFIS